jgi:prophage regulatory protein
MRMLRRPEAEKKVGVGTTKLYDLIKHHEFPKPIKLGRRSLWCEGEVDQWLEKQAAKRGLAKSEAA